MNSYIMKNDNDYRTATNGQGHGVILIKRDDKGIDTAYGYFRNIDADMKEITEQEEKEIQAITQV